MKMEAGVSINLKTGRSKWLQASRKTGDSCPVFRKTWRCGKEIREAQLAVTALGVYEAGKSFYRMKPGSGPPAEPHSVKSMTVRLTMPGKKSLNGKQPPSWNGLRIS